MRDVTFYGHVKKWNRYDKGIIVLILLLALGSLGGAFQLIRIAGVLFLPLVIYQRLFGRSSRAEAYGFLILICWVALGFISLFWSWDRASTAKAVVYQTINFSLFFLLIDWSKKANKPLESIVLAWGLLLVATLSVAVWEVLTFNHLPTAFIEADRVINLGGEVTRYRYASVTFGNHNTYTVLIVFCMNIFGAAFLLKEFRKFLWFFWLVCLLAALVVLINGSRGGVASICFILGAIFLSSIASLRSGRGILTVTVLCLFSCLLAVHYAEVVAGFAERFLYRVAGGDFFSDNTRLALIKSSLQLLSETMYMGVGTGASGAALAIEGNAIHASHNLLIEVLLERGVPGFVLFLLFLYAVYLARDVWRHPASRFVGGASLVIFPLVFVINSGYLAMPALWLYFSSIFVVNNLPRLRSVKLGVGS